MSRWLTDPILTVEHLTMRFGGLVAIDDLSFAVGRVVVAYGYWKDNNFFATGIY